MNYCKTHGTYLHDPPCPECDLEDGLAIHMLREGKPRRSLCGRVPSAYAEPGMNVTDDPNDITCLACKRSLPSEPQ